MKPIMTLGVWLLCLHATHALEHDAGSLREQLLTRHPALVAARLACEQQQEASRFAGRRDPLVVGSELGESLNGEGVNRLAIEFSQEVPLDGSLRLEKRGAEFRKRRAAIALCAQRLELLGEWELSLLDLQGLRQRLAGRSTVIANQDTLLDVLAAQYQRGESDYLSLLRLEQEHRQRSLEQETDRIREAALVDGLLRMAQVEATGAGLDGGGQAPLPVPGSKVHPTDAALLLVEEEGLTELELAGHSGFSNLGLGLGLEAEKDAGDWSKTVSFKLELPLPAPKRQASRRAVLRGKTREEQALRQVAQNHRETELARLELEAAGLRKLLTLQEQQVRTVSRQTELSRKAWKEGLRPQLEWMSSALQEQELQLELEELRQHERRLQLEARLLSADLPAVHDPQLCACPSKENQR